MIETLSGKTAVILGGATGIGRAVTQAYLAYGANVVVADLGHEEALAELRREDGEPRCVTCQFDVRDSQSVKSVLDLAVSLFGRLDICVNNAGISPQKRKFVECSDDDWQNILDINLKGVSYGMRHALKIMLPNRSGAIINTASQLAHKPAPGSSYYSTTKAAVVALTVSVAQEVAEDGIRVNVICPGPTDTPLWRKGDPVWAEKKIMSLPVKRLATPEEIASAYVYLALDSASFMIGQSLSPNGGDVMW